MAVPVLLILMIVALMPHSSSTADTFSRSHSLSRTGFEYVSNSGAAACSPSELQQLSAHTTSQATQT